MTIRSGARATRALLLAVIAYALAITVPTPADAAGRWLTAQQRLIDPVDALWDADLAMSANGYAAVAFDVHAPTAKAGIYVAVRAPGTPSMAASPRGFATAQRVAIVPQTGVASLSVAIDDQGNTTVLWDAYSGQLFQSGLTTASVYRPNGGAWTAAQTVATTPGSTRSQLAAINGGGAVALGDGWMATRQVGTTAFLPSAALPHSADGSGNLSATLNASGTAAVGYTVGGTNALYVIGRPFGGSWSAPERVGTAVRAAVAITDSGRPYAAWNTADNRLLAAARTSTSYSSPATWKTVLDTDGNVSPELERIVASGWDQAIAPYMDYYGDGDYMPSEVTLEPGSSAFSGTGNGDLNYDYAIDDPAWDQRSTDRWAENAAGRKMVLAGDGDRAGAYMRDSAAAQFGRFETIISTTTVPAAAYEASNAAVDAQGNGFVIWRRTIANTDKPDTYLIGVSAFDPNPPLVPTVSVPAKGTVGTGLALTGSALDRMSAVTIAWDFGDGTKATGTSVSHKWTKAGTYTVKVTATDEGGNVSSTTKSIVVSLPALDLKPALTSSVVSGGKTLVKSLTLASVKKGDVVKLGCTGTGCHSSAQRTFTVTADASSLVTKFGATGTGMTLTAGAVVTATISRSGYTAQTAKWTMVSGKSPVRS